MEKRCSEATLPKVELDAVSDHFGYVELGEDDRISLSSARVDEDLHHHVSFIEMNNFFINLVIMDIVTWIFIQMDDNQNSNQENS